MEKCFRYSLLWLVGLIVLGGVSASASAPSYRIEVKSKFHSKHHRDKLWGVVYPNDANEQVAGKDVREFPHVETFYSYDKSVAGYKDPAWSETNDAWRFVKQFAVSNGVVYWMKPTENVINYWNTITGEVGAFQPYNEAGQQLELINKIGYGSITQDWKGNLIFAYYTAQDQAVQGYGTIDGRNTAYGTLVPNVVRLTDMSGNYSQNCAMEWIEGTYKTKPATGVVQTRHPNIPKSDINSLTSTPEGTEVHTQYLTASGDLYDMHWSSSSVYSGYSGGYVFEAYNNIVFANMFANGKYANWYLNYKVQHRPTPTSDYVTTTPYSSYIHEGVYRECDVLEYFWSSPGVAYAEFSHPGGDFLNDGVQYDLLGNLNQYYAYDYGTQDYLPDYKLDGADVALTQTGYDLTAGMESDSIKGHRVLINSSWLNRVPNQYIGAPYNTYVRDGSIDIRTCSYDGGFDPDGVDSDGNPRQWLGNPTRNYTKVATGYGYRNIKCTSPVGGIAVNCWNEIERVNDNVLALYTHVPGQGFSKYFITAVEENNPVTNITFERLCYDSDISNTAPEYVEKGKVKIKLSWAAQKYDRKTLNRYEVWYKTYKRDANGNLVTDCNDTWIKAGVSNIEYAGNNYYPDYDNGNYLEGSQNVANAPRGVFYHDLPYGGSSTSDTSDDYDLSYEYMIIPIYDDSDHRGTEAVLGTKIPSAAPRCPLNATLSQEKEMSSNSTDTLYSFNLKLDVTPNANLEIPYSTAGGKASTPTYWVVIDADNAAQRDSIGNALKSATALVCVDENGNELTGVTATVGADAGITMTANNCYHYYVSGYNVTVTGFDRVYTSSDKFPSLVWKNVDPRIKYKVKVYCNALIEYNFIGTPRVEEEMTIPVPTWSLPEAWFHKLAGKGATYGELTGEGENQPMGAFRRINPETGKVELTNPVTLDNANYYGTNGGAITPIYVTDDVIGSLNDDTGLYENYGWIIDYSLFIYDAKGNQVQRAEFYGQNNKDGYAVCYSNAHNVICDAIGLPVPYKVKDAEDGRTRKVYDPTQGGYTTKLVVEYIRVSDGLAFTKEAKGTLDLGVTTLPELDVYENDNSVVPGSLYPRPGSHYWWDGQYTEGYHDKYYDAAVMFSWESGYDELNRYLGYYAASHLICYGHYETPEATTWTKYLAGSVLTDSEVAGYNEAMNALDGGIGYGSAVNDVVQTNWSALAIANNKVPMQIHYVHGSDEALTSNSAADIKFDVVLTAEYPVIMSGISTSASYPDEINICDIIAAEDPSTYEIRGAERYMQVMTVPTSLSDMYVTSASVTTGVEGVLTEACGGVRLYPNPVGSTFTLQAPMALGEVSIFSADGQLVKVVKDCDDAIVKINVDDLPRGMYIVHALGVAKIMIKE